MVTWGEARRNADSFQRHHGLLGEGWYRPDQIEVRLDGRYMGLSDWLGLRIKDEDRVKKESEL